jgi:hypothetical protein
MSGGGINNLHRPKIHWRGSLLVFPRFFYGIGRSPGNCERILIACRDDETKEKPKLIDDPLNFLVGSTNVNKGGSNL